MQFTCMSGSQARGPEDSTTSKSVHDRRRSRLIRRDEIFTPGGACLQRDLEKELVIAVAY